MTEQNKLKACPFCGSIPESVPQCASGRSDPDRQIWCAECHALGPIKESDEDAITAWNTRTGATEQNKAVEAILSEAKRYAAQEQCDFISYMSSALFAYTEAFESGSEPTGSDLDEARENIASLAALSLAQHIIINSESQEQALAALSRPTQTADAVEGATRQEKPHRNVQKRWKVKRKAVEGNLMGKAFKKAFPDWAHELGFLGYARMGWEATMNGKTVANGQWGDELWLLKDGTFASNDYPFGYSADAAIEKGRIVWEREQAALSHTATSEVDPVADSAVMDWLRQRDMIHVKNQFISQTDAAMRRLIGAVRNARNANPLLFKDDELVTSLKKAETLLSGSRLGKAPPTTPQDSGLAGELLGAQKAIDPTAPTKDIALQQAIAWFDDYTVLHTSKQTPDGERKAQTNKERADYLRTALQSNSDSELLRALSREVIATCKTEYGMLPDDLLARLEQGAA